MAQHMAVREQTVSEWKAGKYRPEGKKLVRLAEILRVPAETLRRDDTKLDGAISLVREPAPSGYVDTRTAEYWRGVLYAAETMSATLTRLLREQREASERLAGREGDPGQ